MRKLNNKKGVAILLVATLILVAVPATLVMLNLSTSQKEQTLHYNNVLNVEQISLSGINMGYSKLKGGYDRGYKIFPAEISGKDRFDLNMTPTGKGFFSQDIYLLLSKAKEGKNSSIIMADAEQFQEEESDSPVLVITHDYWSTPEPFELGVAKDVVAMKNFRGADQLRALDVKKFEMECDESQYKNMMYSLKNALPKDVGDVWDTVVENAANDKIYGEDTPSPDVVGAGYKTYVTRKTGGTSSSKKTSSNKKKSSGSETLSGRMEEMFQGMPGTDSNSGDAHTAVMPGTSNGLSGSNPNKTTSSNPDVGKALEAVKAATAAAAAHAVTGKVSGTSQQVSSGKTGSSPKNTPTCTTAEIERAKGEKANKEREEREKAKNKSGKPK